MYAQQYVIQHGTGGNDHLRLSRPRHPRRPALVYMDADTEETVNKAEELAKLIAAEVKALVAQAGVGILPADTIESMLAPAEQSLATSLTQVIEQYGRLVQEAAAERALMEYYGSEAEAAIREMKLP